MKEIFAAAALGASILLTSSSAFAVSCTQQAGACKQWALGQGPETASYVQACKVEISACITRCKGGSKVFIGVGRGPGGGQQYPINECK